MDGALLVDKHPGVSSFGIIDLLRKAGLRQDERGRPLKIGHGGTLDPFATGLLIVCVGRAVKLSRYFLGAVKTYEAILVFGQTTVPGDPTAEISERSHRLPGSLGELRELARRFRAQPYLQTPPMHSAKKKGGKPLYELAREGIEVEREPKLCRLHAFDFSSFDPPEARFSVTCSAGTYIRTLAQDFARFAGTVGMLRELRRSGSGAFGIERALSVERISEALRQGNRGERLPCFVGFDDLLSGYPRAEATPEEARMLAMGQQSALIPILQRAIEPPESAGYSDAESIVVIHCRERLTAIARLENGAWGLERVFTPES